MPFHFFEEAIGNFPESMYQHKWIHERITYGHWMANNVFLYYPTLLIGLLTWMLYPNHVFIGLGLLIWGAINTIDHILYSIKDRKISPGLFTGIIYLVVSISGLISVVNQLIVSTIIFSILAGIIYFLIPVLLCIKLHKQFKNFLYK
jgi:hypothetical protein